MEEEEEDEDRELVQVKTSVLGISNSSLGDIPVVCKTEEVHTEELLVEEVSVMVGCY